VASHRRSGGGLSLAGIEHQYTDDPVLRGVSLDVEPGRLVALMGPSGCGKSTLLLVAAGILAPSAGSVGLFGTDLSGLSASERSGVRRRDVGIVFQFGELISEFSLRDNVALAAELAGASRRDSLREAGHMLELVGLGELGSSKPGHVSGGQAQRCAVARALVHRPALVIADEPTGALDQHNATVVLDLMIELTRQRDAALLLATHDAHVADRCDSTVRMLDGQLIA
jgi:ABC-type lipoprotein export system ATPase subunit